MRGIYSVEGTWASRSPSAMSADGERAPFELRALLGELVADELVESSLPLVGEQLVDSCVGPGIVSVRATAGFFLEAGQDSSPEPGGPGGRDAQSEWKIAGQEVDDVLLDDASRENGHDGGEILDGVDAAERARAQEREDDGGALSAAL